MAHAQNYDAINTSKNKHCRYQIKKKKTEAKMADTKRAKVKKKKRMNESMPTGMQSQTLPVQTKTGLETGPLADSRTDVLP